MSDMMSKMLGDMLGKVIPKETLDMFAPEKVKELGEAANAFIIEVRERLSAIEVAVNNINTGIEELKNERSGSNSRQPKRNGSGSVAGSSDGTVTNDKQ